MCGIAGELRFDGVAASSEAVGRMIDILEPRGPDAEGLFAHNRVCFGHRRLKIIDLSDHASQPMVDSQLGLTLVFNGAIYNYPELRDELQQKGYTFFSHSDTEVIVKAYHAWGRDCVLHLQGMFAFAVWERDSGRVFFARDRLGIKPLYYHRNSSLMRFASSLPALVKSGGIDTSLGPVALNYYMSFHAVVPAPHTIFNGVKKLPPATTMTVEPDGQATIETYWQADYSRTDEELKRSEEEWIDMVYESLLTSVKRRLVADVPVGVLLSGGLDSSLVVGLLSELGQKHLNTFSVGFEDVAEEEGNEFRYSDIIAERYATHHHKIFVDHRELQTHLSDCIRAMSEPMVSHDVIGFYLLSREVSKHVKVVQSGQGADEVFAGYHWYPPMMEATPASAVETYRNAFFDRDFDEYCQAVSSNYCKEDYATAFVANHFAAPGAEEPIDQALRLDSNVMLVDDPVKRVDNMTMAWGLEARVPFLDHELVELAAKIPGKYKVPDGGKYVLKEVGRRIIPHEVIDRPKGYFPVPALKYLEGDYLDMARSVLNRDVARQRGIFKKEYVDMLLDAPKEHITPLRGSKLWQITLLEYWLQEQGL
ncbi:asparagine synthase family amidotransferase [Chlorobaculum parvum NCIB 8327]|uniref:asparagine synthase (glutamine-hydrolyzing) n=1 Tax=Chlorobaculum parvum (strain DSM 263 / NCIMB 8327) TaxID=517417 RepID=B3QPH1_CHLP8|nr:N-acetylglutaminylglutamine amidotransferase [Chlorobaculum parvum]ACF11824.1 asparagine synthase family amidotransferase [Chlorobaculum parvum NCIB 8327]